MALRWRWQHGTLRRSFQAGTGAIGWITAEEMSSLSWSQSD